MKECCKYCKNLNFYDMYFCNSFDTMEYIEDIDNYKCEMFLKREDKFWIDSDW